MNGNTMVASGGPYLNNQYGKLRQFSYCLPKTSCYKFNILDSAANGISGLGNGFKVAIDGAVLVDTMSYPNNHGGFAMDGVDFGTGCWPNAGATATTGLMTSGPVQSIMFDLSGKLDIVMRRFHSLHLNAPVGQIVKAKIYTKQGSYYGYETISTAWTLVHTEDMTSAGSGSYTMSSAGNFQNGPVAVLGGTTQAFYIVLSSPNLLYGSTTAAQGSIFANFDVFNVRVGIASTSGTAFSPASTSARFSGKITYGTPSVKVRR